MVSIHWSFTPPSHCHHQKQGQQLPYSRQHHSRIKTTDLKWPLFWPEKALFWRGLTLQKLEVIFGSIGIYTKPKTPTLQSALLHFIWVHFPPNQTTEKKHLNRKNIPTCISASTGASFLPPLAALRGAKGVNAAGFGVSGAAAACSGEAARGVATGGAGCRAWAFGALELQASNVQAWMALCL